MLLLKYVYDILCSSVSKRYTLQTYCLRKALLVILVHMEYASKVRLAQFDPSENLDRGASRLKEIAWYLVKICFFFLLCLIRMALKRCFLSFSELRSELASCLNLG